MNILIIEDEAAASRRLEKLIRETEANVNILDTLDSVEAAVEWFQKHSHPDIVFMDIQLADGLSFEIFKQVKVQSPIIFTTAYDQYAIEAFKVNSIDYLLKPVKQEELAQALNKLKMLRHSEQQLKVNYEQLAVLLQGEKKEYQKRFLIKIGQNIKAVDINEAAYFYTEDKINFVCTKAGKNYPLDFSLEKLDEVLDPERFFRINRQFIVSIDCIDEMYAYSKSRVKLKLNPPHKEEPIVSTERSPHFKSWLAGEE